MIRGVGTFLGACFFLVFWSGLARSAEDAGQGQAGGPIMVLEESTHDFGRVSEGEVVIHDFRVVNKGTAPLEIKNVKPG